MQSSNDIIQSLYLTVYDRPADWKDLLYWSEQLHTLGFDETAVAFTQSDEYDLIYGTTDKNGKITTVYQHLLGREPEQDGLDYWAQQLDQGRSVAQIAYEISANVNGKDGEAFHARLNASQDATYGDFIDLMYAGYYGRASDAAGKQYWIEQIKLADGDLSTIIQTFGNSTEYTERFGKLTTTEQITELYLNLFNRAPESDGLSYWEESLTKGELTLANVAFTIANGASGDDYTNIEQQVERLNSTDNLLTLEAASQLHILPEHYRLDEQQSFDLGSLTVSQASDIYQTLNPIIQNSKNADAIDVSAVLKWEITDSATTIINAINTNNFIPPAYLKLANRILVEPSSVTQAQHEALSKLNNIELEYISIIGTDQNSLVIPGVDQESLLTEEDHIVQTLLSGYQWNSDELTFSFLESPLNNYSASNTVEWMPATQAVQDATRAVMAYTSDLLDLSISETSDTIGAHFRINMASLVDANGWAYYPSDEATQEVYGKEVTLGTDDYGFEQYYVTVDGEERAISTYYDLEQQRVFSPGGDIFLDTSIAARDTTIAGDYDYQTIVHELGHALGLKHPFEGDNILHESDDHYAHTTMSYTEFKNLTFSPYLEVDNDSYSYGYDTLSMYTDQFMVYDLATLFYLYGVNMETNTGDTNYTLSTDPYYQTIWDAGGNDTLDFTATEHINRIDLTPGSYSDVNYRSVIDQVNDTKKEYREKVIKEMGWDPIDDFDDFFDQAFQKDTADRLYTGEKALGIAFGTLIENVVGGQNDDLIIDNKVDNILLGGNGDDTFELGAGGFDSVDGGNGHNIIDLSDFSSHDVNIIQFEADPEWSWLLTSDDFSVQFNNIQEIGFADSDNNWLLA